MFRVRPRDHERTATPAAMSVGRNNLSRGPRVPATIKNGTRHPSVVISPAEMRVIDRNAEWMGVRILDLMENAGRAVAEAVLREFAAKGKNVLIVCGTGNNGGDGLTAAR